MRTSSPTPQLPASAPVSCTAILVWVASAAVSSSLLAATLVLLRELRCEASVARRRSVKRADLLEVDMTEAESCSSSLSRPSGVVGVW